VGVCEAVLSPVELVSNLNDFASRSLLHSSLRPDLRSGSAIWIRLDGLSLSNATAHGALCQTLTRVGFGAERGSVRPDTAVLDWSRVASCSAEGFAFFAVLAKKLASQNIHVIVCEPESVAIARFLDESGIKRLCDGVQWVPSLSSGRLTLQSIARAALFSPTDTGMLPDFLDDLSSFVKEADLGHSAALLVMAAAQDTIQNVLSHSSATAGATAATLLPQKRPMRLQLGIADDGVGIASSILSQQTHSWLAGFTDSSVTETVLHRKLTGRSRHAKHFGESVTPDPMLSEAAETPGVSGGGMARLIRRLLDHDGVTIMIRSGTALLTMRSGLPDDYQRRDLTFGAGTQLLLEINIGTSSGSQNRNRP
jgi:hypothetical protein